jgi:hypothetical protein
MFLSGFGICLATLCETNSSKKELRAKARREIKKRKRKIGDYPYLPPLTFNGQGNNLLPR